MNQKKEKDSLAKKSILMYQEVLEAMIPVLEALETAKSSIGESATKEGLCPTHYFNWGFSLVLKEMDLGVLVNDFEEPDDDDEDQEDEDVEEGEEDE